jgi:ribosomal protein S18 acetylase RimI-like enzyme
MNNYMKRPISTLKKIFNIIAARKWVVLNSRMPGNKIIEADYHDLLKVAQLFREYQQFIGVDLCFQGFEEELSSLPGKYEPPLGAIFLAIENEELIGCVAIRPIDQQQAELKRLYVKQASHGQGIGKQLFECAMARAQSIGYDSILLETLESMQSARKLYLGSGFREIEPYYHNPDPSTKFYRYDFG